MEGDTWQVTMFSLSLFLMMKGRKEEETSQEWEDWRLEYEALCKMSL